MKQSMFLYKSNKPGLGLGPYEEEDISDSGNGNDESESFWDKANKFLDTINNAADTAGNVINGEHGTDPSGGQGGPTATQPNRTANLVKTGLWIGAGGLGLYAISRLMSNSKN